MTAIYPGSFDPFTNGHLDIAYRALNVVDRLIIGVLSNTKKQSLFDVEQRVELIREAMGDYKDRIEVESFEGLLVDYCRKKNVRVVVRGLRAVSDFDYEHAIYLMNKEMLPGFETLFFMSSSENSFISSTIIKEVSAFGGDVSDQVPPVVLQKMVDKFRKK